MRNQGRIQIPEDFLGPAAGREHRGDGEGRAGEAEFAGLKLPARERPRIEAHVNGAGGDDGLNESGEGEPGVFDQDATGGVKRGATESRADAGGGEALLD